MGSQTLQKPQKKRKASVINKLGVIVMAVPIAWLAQWHVQSYFSKPKVALVLGGDIKREQFAAEFARSHLDIQVWVSSGSNPEYAQWVFDSANIPADRFRLDYQAVDTVTNFTTLVDELEQSGVDSVYIVTSDYHMRRALIIAQVVLGSRGIHFKPLSVPSEREPETITRGIRDGARAVLWVFTGKTGSEFVRLSRKISGS
jgi:uncharacterized SAM-binding protein YcdF (DUF218 family)